MTQNSRSGWQRHADHSTDIQSVCFTDFWSREVDMMGHMVLMWSIDNMSISPLRYLIIFDTNDKKWQYIASMTLIELLKCRKRICYLKRIASQIFNYVCHNSRLRNWLGKWFTISSYLDTGRSETYLCFNIWRRTSTKNASRRLIIQG